jgi:hypothetical protein
MARAVHGQKYDYNDAIYIKMTLKVSINCFSHGIFLQEPRSHLTGGGCPECFNEIRGLSSLLTTEELIERATKLHGNKYDYSLATYNGGKEKIKIGCPTHGWFWQNADSHLYGDPPHGCPACARERINAATVAKRILLDKWIERSIEEHGTKYDYSLVAFDTISDDVTIVCPVHSTFV